MANQSILFIDVIGQTRRTTGPPLMRKLDNETPFRANRGSRLFLTLRRSIHRPPSRCDPRRHGERCRPRPVRRGVPRGRRSERHLKALKSGERQEDDAVQVGACARNALKSQVHSHRRRRMRRSPHEMRPALTRVPFRPRRPSRLTSWRWPTCTWRPGESPNRPDPPPGRLTAADIFSSEMEPPPPPGGNLPSPRPRRVASHPSPSLIGSPLPMPSQGIKRKLAASDSESDGDSDSDSDSGDEPAAKKAKTTPASSDSSSAALVLLGLRLGQRRKKEDENKEPAKPAKSESSSATSSDSDSSDSDRTRFRSKPQGGGEKGEPVAAVKADSPPPLPTRLFVGFRQRFGLREKKEEEKAE